MSTAEIRARRMTPARMGAVAMIQVVGDPAALDGLLGRLCGTPTPPGKLQLREIPGVDQVVVARPAADCAEIMPHGGRAVTAAVLERLASLGVRCDGPEWDARASYPEAASLLEAEMLAAIAPRPPAPAALEVLLEQPETVAGNVPDTRDRGAPGGEADGHRRRATASHHPADRGRVGAGEHREIDPVQHAGQARGRHRRR